MKIAHINLRSIFTGFNEFTTLILENDFDIVMVTETWLSDDVSSDVVVIPGYRFFRKDRSTRGGGVGAYVKLCINCQLFPFDFLVRDELEYITLKINMPSTTIAICAVYRPPNTNFNNLLNSFDEILSSICPSFDTIICLGDFNVNFLNINNPIEDCFNSYNLTQLINEPTRVTDTTSTLIDPIFISNEDMVLKSGTISADGISDHKLVFCDIKILKCKMKPKLVTFRCFKNFILNEFLIDLHSLPWHNIIYENNIDKKIGLFNEYIISLFDIHAPIRNVRVTKPKAPWLTPNLKIIMKERDEALRKFKRTKADVDKGRYKQLRNFTVTMVRAEKRGYLDSVFRQNNIRNTWSALKSLNIRSTNDLVLPEELADPNKINNYFASFLQNVSNNCDEQIEYYNNNYKDINISFQFKLTTVDEVNACLHNIKTVAYGVDGISSTMLKYCSPFIDQFITHIINCCIEQNYFPHLWKEAIGKPLPKIRDPTTFSDLRIVSILPAMSKVFERILHNQIYEYTILNNILSDSQCGFRKGFCTATALAAVTDEILHALDNGLVSVLVLLDFSKAFDTINHKLICTKLKYYGFLPPAISLLTSYLSDRSQKVVVNNVSSLNLSIMSGVPQGSILGPLLFIIYTTELLNSLSHCKVQAYADDTVIYKHFSIDNCAHSVLCVNSELSKINRLSIDHELKLNSNKSKVMLFGNKNKINYVMENFEFNVDGSLLPVVKEANCLGVTLDSNFRFKGHTKKLLQRAYSSLKLLYSNRHLLNCKLRIMLCDSLVLSHFNYCDFIYGPCMDQLDKNRLQKVQNSCCRMVFGLRKFDHISHKLKDCNWLNMCNRREHHMCNFVHKILNSTNSSYILKSKFILRSGIHDRNTRFKNKFVIPQHHSSMFKRSFSFNAVSIYNSLPEQFKIYNINKFKYKHKEYLYLKQ